MLKTRTVKMYGTTIDIKISGKDSDSILDNCLILLEKYNDIFSMYDENSDLYSVNKNSGIKAIKVNDELFELIEIGKLHSLANNSNLNITIGPLVKAWNIGSDNPRVPSDDEIKDLLSITNPDKIILDKENKTVYLEDKGMEIDLGALAKGYISDRIMDYIKSKNADHAIINMGGNVLTFGPARHNHDGNWRIGIQNPELARGNHVALLAINDASIVTSGIYERKFSVDDKTYHHILDPNTGRPIKSDIASITIVSKKSVDCEIWTTRLFGKDSKIILDEINRQCGVETVIIKTNGEVIFSKGIRKFIMN